MGKLLLRPFKKRIRPLTKRLKQLPQMGREPVWHPFLQQLSDTSVIISWATHKVGRPQIRYFVEDGPISITTGNSQSIPFRIRPWPAPFVQLHRVTLTNLQPNTTYHYQPYLDSQCLENTYRFRTAPKLGTDSPFSFITMGDFGNGSYSQRQLRNQLLQNDVDFLLTVGDNSQGEGTYSQFHDTVFQIYRDLFCQIGLFTTLGNHDYLTDNGAPYLDIFALPQQVPGQADQGRYYSFDYGNVHFVVLDSNLLLKADAPPPDTMLEWLKHDLASTIQPWKIVTCHHPPYNTGSHGNCQPMLKTVVPILEDYKVDIVLSGHQHTYQRSHPIKQQQVTSTRNDGIVYIITGAGAAAKAAVGEADWLAYGLGSVRHGLYTRILVNGPSMQLEAVDHQGIVHDQYHLYKSKISEELPL